LLPFAAGSFLYIAWSDLIPELHKENKPSKALIQLLTFLLGIWVMCLLLLIW
jgi:zinc and cadmium transporter